MNDRLRAATLSNDNYNWPASRYNTVLPYRNAHSNPTPDSMQNGFIIDRGFIDPSGPMTYRLNLFEKDRFESGANLPERYSPGELKMVKMVIIDENRCLIGRAW